jgi:hypothetical protein
MDGSYLFATDHPQLQGTQANRPASGVDLSYAALEDARVNLMTQQTYEGYPLAPMDKYILMFNPANINLVDKLMGDNYEAFQANYTVNTVRSMFEPLSNPYLPDEDAWFCLPKPRNNHLMMFWRIRPHVWMDRDPNNGDYRFFVRFRMSNGFVHWYYTYASPGS